MQVQEVSMELKMRLRLLKIYHWFQFAYNKTKMVSERVLYSYRDHLKVHCIRPATVCGYSPRMRLDVSVKFNYASFKIKK